MKTTAIASLLTMGFVGVTEAAEAVNRWTGFYGGVSVGYAWFETEDRSVFQNIRGGMIGGQVGYVRQLNSLVFGIEIDGHWASIGETVTPALVANSVSAKTDGFASVRGRAGFVADGALVYATAGYGLMHNTFSSTSFLFADLNWKESRFHHGVVGGAGVEIPLTAHWSGRLEYLFARYFSQVYFGTSGSGDVDVHAFKAGINYLFRAADVQTGSRR